ncbi:hypothetical protein FIBSPDRAFT_877517, partial [Athelia psychrophila]
MVRVSKSPAATIQPADVLTRRRARQSPPSHPPRQHFNVMLRAPIAASTSTGPDAMVGIMQTITSNAIDATRRGCRALVSRIQAERVPASMCTHHCAHRGPHYRRSVCIRTAHR